MLPTNAKSMYPVIDNFGLVRAIVLIFPGEEWRCKKRCEQVTVAVSFALGEKSADWTSAPIETVKAEINRRISHRPPEFTAETVGIFEIVDGHNRPNVLIGVLRGRESECQRIASSVVATVARFNGSPTHINVYDL